MTNTKEAKILASLGPWWWQHLIVIVLQEHCITMETDDPRINMLIPTIYLCL